MSEISEMRSVEQRAAVLLEGAEYFGDVLIRTPHHGDLSQVIQQRLAAAGLSKTDFKKSGLLVLCSVTGATLNTRALQGPVSLDIAVLENPLVNQSAQGTGKLALDAAEQVIRALADKPVHENANPETAISRFALRDPSVELISPDEKKSRYGVEGGIGYQVNFTVEEQL
jgi:hypothetical protein